MTTYHSFNLFDYVSSIHSPEIASNVAQSTAWRIDTLIVQQARNLFKEVRRMTAEQSNDNLADITAAMKEFEFAEASFGEAGHTLDGTCEIIRALNAQRDQWHDLAKELTSLCFDYNGTPRRYETPELESAFYNDKPFKVNRETQRRMKMSIDRRAKVYDWDDDTKARSFERKLAHKEDKLEEVKESLNDTAPIGFMMYTLALKNDDSSCAMRPKEFTALPIETQRVLLRNAVDAANRANEWMQDSRNATDSDVDAADDSALNIEIAVNKALRSERFREVETQAG